MDNQKLKSIIESLLFVWGDPLDLKSISDILKIDKSRTKMILDEMIKEFDDNIRGLKIICIQDNYQLCTRPEHEKWIVQLSGPSKTKSLSNAALETLSIIAYKQPVTRNDIEEVRGVRCDRAIQTLMDKSLIKEKGRLQTLGRPIIYGTTIEFLRYFGLKDLNGLPPLKDLKIENLGIDSVEE